MSEKKVLTKKEQTRQMTILAMFIAIIAVLGLVPNGLGGTIGFIKIAPTIEATIVHIPVLIGAVLLGRKMGIYLGLAFGVVANIAAFIYASPFFVYPWVAILPRFVFGLLIYDFTKIFIKLFKNKYLGIGVSFFLLTLIHTILVLFMFWTSYALVYDLGLFEAIKPYFAFLVLYNVIPFTPFVEAAIAAVVGSVIVINLARYLKNTNNTLLEIEVD
ncbi:ECF transporter S component [Candidatus Izemoplasma sp. B36]|uniref:ECF transporter S component n=1 Tax=Candidatus Izemoplasma sp. B36 TaxID=3242468 RepID=UPI00355621A9